MTVFCFQSGWTSCPAARTFSVDLFPPNCIQLWILWTFWPLEIFLAQSFLECADIALFPISTLMCGWISCFYLLTVTYLRQNQLEYASFLLNLWSSSNSCIPFITHSRGIGKEYGSGLFCMSARTDSTKNAQDLNRLYVSAYLHASLWARRLCCRTCALMLFCVHKCHWKWMLISLCTV